jgi:hypothetical protein
VGPEVHELLESRCVKGAGCNVGNTEGAKAGAHLSRCSSRKCKGKNSLGIYDADINCVGQAVSDGASFSSTSSCNDADRSTYRSGNSALFSIERSKNFFC